MSKKVNKLNKLKRILDTSLVHGLVFTLLSSSTPVLAQDHWIDTAQQALGMGLDAISQNNQQIMMQQQKAAFLEQFKPVPVQAQFFPHCKISPAISAYPEDMCMDDINDPSEFSTVSAMKEAGFAQKSFYEQILTPAQNSKYPVGLQCIENARKGVETSFQERLDSLNQLMTDIRNGQELFEAQNKLVKEKMKDLNAELFGGARNTIDAKTQDYSKFFNQDCQNIIGASNIANPREGLMGLFKTVKPLKTASANFASKDKAVYKKEIEEQIQDMKDKVAEMGVSGYLNSLQPGFTSYKNYEKALTDNIRDFKIKEAQYTADIRAADPTYTIPTMDKSFNVNFSEFVNSSEDYFKKKYINECVTMEDKGIALSTSQILKGLEQKSTGNRGTTVIRYRDALADVLNDKSITYDERMQKIRALHNSDITVTYVNGKGKQVTDSPYVLFQKTAALCEQKYLQADSTNPNTGQAASQANKVKTAKKALQDLKKLESTFLSEMKSDIEDRVLECKGVPLKSNSCNATAFTPGNDNFCIKNADSCTTQINQCYNQANNLVEDRKTRLKGQAGIYNQNIEHLVVQQKAFLEQLKQKVIADGKYLQQYFPGANYKIPEDLRIDVPELQDTEFGIQLFGGGTLKFLDNLPKEIDKLKESLASQGRAIDREVKKYMDDQKAAMVENKKKWEKLANNCASLEADYREKTKQYNQEQAQQYNAGLAEAKNFCRRFDKLAGSNPAAGCGEGDFSPEALYEDSSKVVSFLSSEVEASLNAYSNICNKSQNERNAGTEEEDETPISDLSAACQENGNDWETVKSNMIESIIAQRPEGMDDEAIDKFLNGGDKELNDIEDGLASTTYGRQLTRVRNSLEVDDSYVLPTEPSSELTDVQTRSILDSFGGKAACASVKSEDKDRCEAIVMFINNEKTTNNLIEYLNKRDTDSGSTSFGSNIATALSTAKKYKTPDNADHSAQVYTQAARKFHDNAGDNICKHHQNFAAIAAYETCAKDSSKTNCFRNEFRENMKGVDKSLRGVNRSIASTRSNSLSDEWSDIGEQRTQSCIAEVQTGQRNSGAGFFGSSFGPQGIPRYDNNQGVIR
jgi:hypothetical protein